MTSRNDLERDQRIVTEWMQQLARMPVAAATDPPERDADLVEGPTVAYSICSVAWSVRS